MEGAVSVDQSRTRAPQSGLVDEAERAATSISGRLSAVEREASSSRARVAGAGPQPETAERTRGGAVGEKVRPRVERLREASVVVFDEAAEDPGTRFVVVAVALFVVFLLIILFSYVLK